MRRNVPLIEHLEARIAPAFAPVFELSGLNGLNGFKLTGASVVSDAGDINGDGYADLIIGAPTASDNGFESGASYVVFGKESGLPANLNLSALNGTNGFKISAAAADDWLGYSVSAAGDVNDDGFGDVIIGAWRASPDGLSNAGASYVVFGKATGFAANLNVSTLDGTNGFKVSGSAVNGYAAVVSAAGDVNGDGFDDVIIGASPGGASYVVFGKASGFAANLKLSALDGNNGFRLASSAGGELVGLSVSGGEDFNGDGFDDLMIGAPDASPNGASSGTSYVVFGKATGFTANFNLSTLNGSNGFKINGAAEGDLSGWSVSAAGDMNGDAIADMMVGAWWADPNGSESGAAYVVFGKVSGFAPTLNLSALDGSNGFKLSGVAAGDWTAYSVSGAGDVNGDGLADVIAGTSATASYVVFGKASGHLANLNLSSLDGSNGFKLQGGTGDLAVSAAGDVNGDGLADLIIGAPRDPNVTNQGASYVVFGQQTSVVPSLTIGNISLPEGDADTKAFHFPVRLSAAATEPVTVQFSTLPGMALADSDFTTHAGVITFAPGEIEKMITVMVRGDASYELDESFTVALSNASGALIGTGIGTGTIQNDDAQPIVSIAPASIVEGNTGTSSLDFIVSLSAPSGFPARVNFATLDGTARAGSDYTALPAGPLTFAPGETTKIITVEAFGDATHEGDETMVVALSEPIGATLGTAASTGTILNDDAPPLIRIAGGSVVEGDTGVQNLPFTVTLSATSEFSVSVNVAAVDGTGLAGSDYTALTSGTLTFAPGETSKVLIVEVLGDTEIEGHEAFDLVLSAPAGGTIDKATATGTIINDDDDIDSVIQIEDASILEGNTGTNVAIFTVTIDAASTLPVTVNFLTVEGTAMAGSDFTAASGVVMFAPGETSKTIAVEVNGDTDNEAHESFSILLSNPTNVAIADATGTGLILNDDTSIRIDDESMLEGHGGTRTITFHVSLAAPSSLPVTVDFTTTDGTAAGNVDYLTLAPGILTFAPGETNKTLNVALLSDAEAEQGESFSIVLANPANAALADAVAVGTILNDDVTLVKKRKATFTDADGDLVTIKVSKGSLKVEDFTILPTGDGAGLALVDFAGETQFAGARLSVTAKTVKGGAGDGLVNTGYVNATDIDLNSITIDGDLGRIDCGDGESGHPAMQTLTVASIGSLGLKAQLPAGSLRSHIDGDLRKLKVTGSILGGASLAVSGRLDSASVGGSIDGADITVLGDPSAAKATKAIAIGRIDVSESVMRSQILAGYDSNGAAMNGNAGVGKIAVGSDWIASSLVAGVSAGEDGYFGTDDDSLIGVGREAIARIASVLVKGSVLGTSLDGDHFGFVAEEIGTFRIGNSKLQLSPGERNDLTGHVLGTTRDVIVREVA